MLRTMRVLTVVLALGAGVPLLAGARPDVEVTGAWTVTITKPGGTASAGATRVVRAHAGREHESSR